MREFANKALPEWIQRNGQQVEAETKMVADVRLFASDWEIKNFDGVDKDSVSPLYAGQSDRIKALKKKPYWFLINPIYRLYANVKVRTILFARMDKKTAFVKLCNKISVKWKNRPSVIWRRNRAFLKKITLSEEELQRQRDTKFEKDVKISVIVPLYNTPERYLRDMIESVQAQTYGNWELCMGDGSDAEHPEVERIAKEYAAKDSRVVYQRLEKNEGISGNTNACLKFATGSFVALFDHDDMLHPAALFRCMEMIEKEDAELIYTDEMTFEGNKISKIATLHFKPAYSPQNLNGVNYITHLCVFKKELLAENGLYNDAYDGSQDHDMILRLTTAAKKVSHVPEILYFWRVHPGSVSADISAKPYAIDAGRRAVHDNEARLGREAKIHSSCICATHYRLDYELPEEPKVQVVVVYREKKEALGRLLSSMTSRTKYDNYTVTILKMGDMESDLRNVLKEQEPFLMVRDVPAEKNLAEALNDAVYTTDANFTVFLTADTEIVDENWLHRLVQYEMQENIGLTGSRITDRYGMVREAGYIIGMGEDGVAFPIEHKNNYSAPGYMGRMYYAHNVSALSLWGAMVEKEKFRGVGGFSEDLQGSAYLGIDLSLKFRDKNQQVVLNPYVIHMAYSDLDEKKELDAADAEKVKNKWAFTLENGDPYYNQNLSEDGSWTFGF